jgi:phage terminase large subunit-like protein
MAKKDMSLSDMLLNLGETLTTTAHLPNITRYDPHKKQQRFHHSKKKGRLYIGGNRAGKTTANVVECCWWLTKTHPSRKMPDEPVRGRLVCVDFLNGLDKIILPQFKQWLPKKYLIDGEWEKSYDKEHKTLTLNNNSFIEFMSYDQDLDKFAGTSRHFISCDEEPPKHIFNECKARLVDTDGDWWISMTPLDGLTWIYEDIYAPVVEKKLERECARYEVVQADMLDNPHISKAAAEEFLAGLDPQERAAREKGTFVQLGGRVFKNFNPEVHAAPLDFFPTPQMRIFTSLDTGWAHPAAWLWHAVEPDGHITTFHEMVQPLTTIEDWAKQIKEYENFLWEQYKVKVFTRTGDPAMRQTKEHTGTSVIMEYARHGIYIGVDSVPAGPNSVNIGLIKIEQYMKPDKQGRPYWQYTKDCRVLEHQMMRLRWATYASKKMEFENAPKGTIHKKDDDAPDSLRYFMTLMPDLKFDDSPEDAGPKSVYNIESVKDVPYPYYDSPSARLQPQGEESSIYQIYNAPDSDWELEGVG